MLRPPLTSTLGVSVTLSDINRLGARKYFENHGVYKNPYAVGTPEFNEFERGWMQSLKKDEGRLAGKGERQAERQSNRAATTSSETEVAAERYRSRKG